MCSWDHSNVIKDRMYKSFAKFNNLEQLRVVQEVKRRIKNGARILFISFDGQWSFPQKKHRRAKHCVVTFMVYLSDGTRWIVLQTFAHRDELYDNYGEVSHTCEHSGAPMKCLEKITTQEGLLKLVDLQLISDILSSDGCRSSLKNVEEIYSKLVKEEYGILALGTRDQFHFVPSLRKKIREYLNFDKKNPLFDVAQVLLMNGIVEVVEKIFMKCVVNNENEDDLIKRLENITNEWNKRLCDEVKFEINILKNENFFFTVNEIFVFNDE